MIIKIKKYVATVADFVEHQDGTISKELCEVEIKGARISEATVWKQIPRTAKLIGHGYRTSEYEVETALLENWLRDNARVVEAAPLAAVDSE